MGGTLKVSQILHAWSRYKAIRETMTVQKPSGVMGLYNHISKKAYPRVLSLSRMPTLGPKACNGSYMQHSGLMFRL